MTFYSSYVWPLAYRHLHIAMNLVLTDIVKIALTMKKLSCYMDTAKFDHWVMLDVLLGTTFVRTVQRMYHW